MRQSAGRVPLDQLLQQEAQSRQIPLYSLESVDEQIAALAALPEADQFRGQGFGGKYPIGFGHFTLEKSLGFGAVSHGMVCRFNICPCKIAVSVFLIVFAFFLAIGGFFTFHATAI